MIKVEECALPGVKLITVDAFEDHRGEYVETYNEKLYKEAGITADFPQDDYSKSTRNVLRGLHGDEKTWKLITCPHGKIYLVVLNYDEGSPAYGKWLSFVLSERNHKQVLIPPRYANGHLVLSRQAIFQYKQSCYYEGAKQFTVKWDDPRFKIWWPIKEPILSRRDAGPAPGA